MSVLALVALVRGGGAAGPLVEEPYLLAMHGAAYAAYAARAGRFVPGIGRLPARAGVGGGNRAG